MELDAIRMSDGASAACEVVEFAADDDLTGRSGPWEAASSYFNRFILFYYMKNPLGWEEFW